MKWIKLTEKIPTQETDGEYILIYTQTSGCSKSLGIRIQKTNKLKYYNIHQTWWMPLPPIPNE